MIAYLSLVVALFGRGVAMQPTLNPRAEGSFLVDQVCYYHRCVQRIKEIVRNCVLQKKIQGRMPVVHIAQEMRPTHDSFLDQGVVLYIDVFHEFHTLYTPYAEVPVIEPAMIYPDDIKAWQEIFNEIQAHLTLTVYKEKRDKVGGKEYVKTWYMVEAIDGELVPPVVLTERVPGVSSGTRW